MLAVQCYVSLGAADAAVAERERRSAALLAQLLAAMQAKHGPAQSDVCRSTDISSWPTILLQTATLVARLHQLTSKNTQLDATATELKACIEQLQGDASTRKRDCERARLHARRWSLQLQLTCQCRI